MENGKISDEHIIIYMLLILQILYGACAIVFILFGV